MRREENGGQRGEHGEPGTGIGYRGYGMTDGSRVWSGNCEGQGTEEMTWEVENKVYEEERRVRAEDGGRKMQDGREYGARIARCGM